MKFKPNKYQEAIYDFIKNGEGNAVISASAGSGKTSTLVSAIDVIDPSCSVLFLAFNKSIVEELKRRIGDRPNVDVKTLHSLGSSLCFKTYRSVINAEKYVKYINTCVNGNIYKPEKDLTYAEKFAWKRNIQLLCDLARVELTTDPDNLRVVCDKHDILLEDNEIECALDAVRWGESNVAEIDFTDMIYFPNVKKMDIPVYDFVFIDECQDLNSAQRGLFLKCVDPDDGRFICVGDKSQSLYFFNGADAESFDKLTNIPNTRILPLSVCYRCDRKIIDVAKKLVPQIECRENAGEGVIDKDAKIEDVRDGDLIICRITAPLVSLCIKYIKDGKKAFVKGKDIGANLVSLLRKTNKDNVNDAIEALLDDELKLINKICKLNGYTKIEAKDTSKYQIFADKVDAIIKLSRGYKKTEDVINMITRIFSDSNGEGICLSTVHKAKGLENDRVFILNENSFYPKWAMKNQIQARQEKNLEYVAVTRPKTYLGYITYEEDSGNKLL